MEEQFFITESAEKKISEILKQESLDAKFRVSVQSGGCSGFQYQFLIDDNITGDDKTFSQNNAHLVIDSISLGFLGGSSIDYLVDLSGEKFVIKNPNAASGCGCGNSFSV